MLKILKEGNEQSAQILAQAIASDKFKDKDARNTIIRANDLFNELSNAGNNILVQVNASGETRLRILFNDGYVQATIMNPTAGIKLYSGGQFELNQDNLNKINDILNIINKY